MANEAPRAQPGRMTVTEVAIVLVAALAVAVVMLLVLLRLYGNRAEIMVNRQIGNNLVQLSNDQTTYIMSGNRRLDELSVKVNGVWYKLGQPIAPVDQPTATTRP